MKKLLSIILALTLLSALSVPVFASETPHTPTGGTTELTYSVTASYSIKIPETLTVAGGSGSGDYEVNSGSLIEGGKKLTFTITGATNYDDTGNKFRMKNGSDASVFLGYSITKPDGTDDGDAPDAVVMNTAFLEVLASEAYAGKKVRLTYTTETAEIAGSYSDTVTVSVACVPAT